jgi:hypothetical protein
VTDEEVCVHWHGEVVLQHRDVDEPGRLELPAAFEQALLIVPQLARTGPNQSSR